MEHVARIPAPLDLLKRRIVALEVECAKERRTYFHSGSARSTSGWLIIAPSQMSPGSDLVYSVYHVNLGRSRGFDSVTSQLRHGGATLKEPAFRRVDHGASPHRAHVPVQAALNQLREPNPFLRLDSSDAQGTHDERG